LGDGESNLLATSKILVVVSSNVLCNLLSTLEVRARTHAITPRLDSGSITALGVVLSGDVKRRAATARLHHHEVIMGDHSGNDTLLVRAILVTLAGDSDRGDLHVCHCTI
jgi:hypothetical protein